MKRILATLLCCALALSAFAQPNGNQRQGQRQGGGGFAAELPYPVVYEGPDVVFRQVDDHLWVGSGHGMASETLYIVEGEKKAVLIDAGTKIPGLDKIVEQITDKPYDVILTHVHPDHAGGCDNFDEIWLHKEDESMLAGMCPDFKGKVNYLKEGDKIDLGGRVLEVFHTPGHTLGSITFVDRENHYGFSGDAFGNGNLLLFTDLTTMINTCEKTLKWMQKNDIYMLWNGHFFGSNHETTKQIYNLKRICEDVLSGKVVGNERKGGFGGNMVYTRDGINLNYSSDKIR